MELEPAGLGVVQLVEYDGKVKVKLIEWFVYVSMYHVFNLLGGKKRRRLSYVSFPIGYNTRLQEYDAYVAPCKNYLNLTKEGSQLLFFVFQKRPVTQLKMCEPNSFHVEDKGDELLSTVKVKVVGQRNTVTRVHHRDFMFNVAVERNIRNRRIFLSRGEGRRIKDPFFTFVAEVQRTAFMTSGENDDKRYTLAPGSVFVRLEKISRASKEKKKIMHHRLASNLTHRKCLICTTRI